MMANSLAGSAGTNPTSMRGTVSAGPAAVLEDYFAQQDAARKMEIVKANQKKGGKEFDKTSLVEPGTGNAVLFDKASGEYGYMAPDGWKSVPNPVERKKVGKGSISAGTGASKKPLKQGQAVALGFGKRVEQALAEMADLEAAGYDRASATSSAESLLPNIGQGEASQRQAQAERNFINAVLRRESGASIAPTEFESAEKQYFPRFGDTEATKAQKRRNREQALESLKAEVGSDIWSRSPTVKKDTPSQAPEPGILQRFFGGEDKPAADSAKSVVRKQYSPSRNKTRIEYSDGTTEMVDGKQ